MIPQHVLDALLAVEVARESAIELDLVADEAEESLAAAIDIAEDARQEATEELRLVGHAVDEFLEVFNAYLAEVTPPTTTTPAP